jgi:hypothetical protein
MAKKKAEKTGPEGPQGPDQPEAEVKDTKGIIDPEASKRGGEKEVAQNSDVIAIEQEKNADIPDEKAALPSFFVDKTENHRVTVDILTRKTDGRIVSIARTGLGLNYEQFDKLQHTEEWFEFTMPDYDAMANYRQKSAVYRREAESMLVDKLQLRNYLLVWHLKDWSMRDKNGEKVELEHDDDTSLTEDSIEKVYAMHTTILDVVLTIFEKDLLLT